MIVVDILLNVVDFTVGKQPKYMPKLDEMLHREGLMSEAESEDIRHVPIQERPTFSNLDKLES